MDVCTSLDVSCGEVTTELFGAFDRAFGSTRTGMSPVRTRRSLTERWQRSCNTGHPHACAASTSYCSPAQGTRAPANKIHHDIEAAMLDLRAEHPRLHTAVRAFENTMHARKGTTLVCNPREQRRLLRMISKLSRLILTRSTHKCIACTDSRTRTLRKRCMHSKKQHECALPRTAASTSRCS